MRLSEGLARFKEAQWLLVYDGMVLRLRGWRMKGQRSLTHMSLSRTLGQLCISVKFGS